MKKWIKKFYLERIVDDSGVSGTGIVAVGCQFPNGWVNLYWLKGLTGISFYASMKDLMLIHGHKGHTRAVYFEGDLEEERKRVMLRIAEIPRIGVEERKK